MSANVLIIGLDGGTFDLLLPLMEQGHMPALRQQMEKGSWGRLESTIPPFTAAAWSSFATGQNPGQHGVLSFRQWDRFDHHQTATGFADARQLRRPLWTLLSGAGKRTAVVNVPLSYPPRPVNGLMVTGMMTPDNASHFTFPPALAQELGDYQIDVDFIREEEGFRRYGLPPKGEMLAEISQVSRKRTAAARRLLQQEAWDFYMLVYTGTDRVSHFFWDELEAICRTGALAGNPSPYHQGLIEYFRELDRDIGRLVADAGPEAHILFMSDHGFGPSPTRRFSVNLWLERHGFMQPAAQTDTASLSYWHMKVGRMQTLKKLLRRVLPQEIQDRLADRAHAGAGPAINWSQTRAYFVPIYFHVCGIELNTIGEHRDGCVTPGAEYEAIRTEIIAAISQASDPRTGRKIVRQVAPREALFSGPYVATFPDIILILDPDYVGGSTLASSEIVEHNVPFRSGEHRSDGIFIAGGPRVTRGEDLPALHLMDVSPTVLYLLDEPIPTDFDGRVLEEIIDPAVWAAHPPKKIDPRSDAGAGEEEVTYSAHEEAQLEERLRSLGYLE